MGDSSTPSSGEDDFEWCAPGTVGPRTTNNDQRPRRDLGAGGSLLADADRARHLRLSMQPVWSTPRTLAVGAGTACLIGIALVASAAAPLGIAGGILALCVCLVLAASAVRQRLVHSDSELRLQQRARIEQRLAAELDTLRSSGWALLHDRVLPGSNHRVAHLAIGPAGVCVMTPLPAGALSIVGHEIDGEDLRQLYAGSLHLGPWLSARQWEVEQLEPAIAGAMQDTVWEGPTIPMAVQVPAPSWRDQLWPRRLNQEVPDMPYEWQGILLSPIAAVTSLLHGLPAPLSRTEVAELEGTVAQLCPPAGRDQPAAS